MLHALADAGHRVDLLTPRSDLPDHPHIRVLIDSEGRPLRRAKLRQAGRRAARRNSYDAVQAVDEALFFAMALCRRKKVPLIYDAVRCFSGKAASRPFGPLSYFPKHLQRIEARALERAALIFSPCRALTNDLRRLDANARVMQLAEIPAQPLFAPRNADTASPSVPPGMRSGLIVVCSALPGHVLGFRNLLVAARKVIEAEPDAAFFFRGLPQEQAEKTAANLDISNQCVFLPPDDPHPFLSALEIADAVLMVPPGGGRYIHPQVYTLLHAGAPLVTIRDAVYDEVLTEKTAVHVLPNPESIAEGLLRVIREPLFSLAVALEGQQLVADQHTYSSFKHKVRMAYRGLSTPD
jgi:hypothetical protein